jgi:hypothetical protein
MKAPIGIPEEDKIHIMVNHCSKTNNSFYKALSPGYRQNKKSSRITHPRKFFSQEGP